jgi:LysR family transcriptional regulator, nitrogen assimilation regulatory protein
LNFRQLRTLVHIGELGSLSKAADRLHVAQPALSRQIRALEDEIGTPLFTRHGRGMVLTQTGELLVERANNILRQVEEARADAISSGSWVRGSVVIGMPPTVADILAGRIAKEFTEQHPDVNLHFVSAFSMDLIDRLLKGTIDMAMLYDPKSHGSLYIEPLLQEDLFLVAPAAEKLDLDKPISFKDLSKDTLLLPGAQHSLRQLIETCARDVECSLEVTMEADSLSLLRNFVSHGLGRTILPLPSVYKDIEAGLLSAAPISDPSPTRSIVLATATDRAVSKATQRAIEMIKKEVAEMMATNIWVGLPL